MKKISRFRQSTNDGRFACSCVLRLRRRALLAIAACALILLASQALAGILGGTGYALTTIATFNGADGSEPRNGLVADSSGNLYGTTNIGGTNNLGTVFEIAAGTHTLTTLVNFNGTNGKLPQDTLFIDASGNIWGTTENGGANSAGTVFELAAVTHAFSTVASLGFTDGSLPLGGLVADSNGNLYGTTLTGPNRTGFSTVYEINATTHAASTIATFNGSNGGGPYGNLIVDSGGNLYGTAQSGGAQLGGAIFKVAAGTHAISDLASFTVPIGEEPVSGLYADASGHFYGTTTFEGGEEWGSIFEYSAQTNSLIDLHDFIYSDGAYGYGNLISDAHGNLWGTTGEGGSGNDGVVFEMSLATHAVTDIASFSGSNGNVPEGGLVEDSKGDFYGVTETGGANNDGIVFELSPVPEPASLVLAAFAAGSCLMLLHRKRVTTMSREEVVRN